MSIQGKAAKTYDWRLVARLLGYVRAHLPVVYVLAATVAGGTAVELAQPWLTQKAIDRHILTGDYAGLYRIAAILVGTLIVGSVCDYGRTRLLQMIGQRVANHLRVDAYRHLLTLDLRFHDSHPIGHVMSTVTSDVEALNEMFSSGAVLILGNVITLAGLVIAMLAMDWRLACVTFAVLPLAAWVTHWFQVGVRESSRRVREMAAQLNGFIQEHLAGMATVQLFMQEERIAGRFETLNVANREAGRASLFFLTLLNPAIEVVASLSSALVLWVGGLWALEGSITAGVLVAFILYLRRFFQPFLDLAEKANVMQSAMAGAERIFNLLDRQPAITSPATAARHARQPAGRIEFDRVSFAYGETLVLKNVSFAIEPGEHVGIAGPTGCGKTTVLNLILRFYDAVQGRVLVDGVDVRDWDEQALRRVCNVVLQDSYLFPGTVLENIRCGSEAVTEEEVERAAKALGIHDLIHSRLGGYQAMVSERSALSIGERQLLALTRGIVSGAGIVLLDEATSALDSQTEAHVNNALREATAGRTLVGVAHRLSTLRYMDRVLAFSHGELVESGSHQELLKRGGVYSRLYQLQGRK